MPLVISRNGRKRSNPSRRPLITETVNEVMEKKGSCVEMTTELKPSSTASAVETSQMTPCQKRLLFEKYCEKRSAPQSNKSHQVMENIDTNNNIVDAEDGEDEEDGDKGVEREYENVQNCCDTMSEREMENVDDKHELLQIHPTEKKKWPQKPCVYCRKYGPRRDTRYICSLCNVALCKNRCFSNYHSCK